MPESPERLRSSARKAKSPAASSSDDVGALEMTSENPGSSDEFVAVAPAVISKPPKEHPKASKKTKKLRARMSKDEKRAKKDGKSSTAKKEKKHDDQARGRKKSTRERTSKSQAPSSSPRRKTQKKRAPSLSPIKVKFSSKPSRPTGPERTRSQSPPTSSRNVQGPTLAPPRKNKHVSSKTSRNVSPTDASDEVSVSGSLFGGLDDDPDLPSAVAETFYHVPAPMRNDFGELASSESDADENTSLDPRHARISSDYGGLQIPERSSSDPRPRTRLPSLRPRKNLSVKFSEDHESCPNSPAESDLASSSTPPAEPNENVSRKPPARTRPVPYEPRTKYSQEPRGTTSSTHSSTTPSGTTTPVTERDYPELLTSGASKANLDELPSTVTNGIKLDVRKAKRSDSAESRQNSPRHAPRTKFKSGAAPSSRVRSKVETDLAVPVVSRESHSTVDLRCIMTDDKRKENRLNDSTVHWLASSETSGDRIMFIRKRKHGRAVRINILSQHSGSMAQLPELRDITSPLLSAAVSPNGSFISVVVAETPSSIRVMTVQVDNQAAKMRTTPLLFTKGSATGAKIAGLWVSSSGQQVVVSLGRDQLWLVEADGTWMSLREAAQLVRESRDAKSPVGSSAAIVLSGVTFPAPEGFAEGCIITTWHPQERVVQAIQVRVTHAAAAESAVNFDLIARISTVGDERISQGNKAPPISWDPVSSVMALAIHDVIAQDEQLQFIFARKHNVAETKLESTPAHRAPYGKLLLQDGLVSETTIDPLWSCASLSWMMNGAVCVAINRRAFVALYSRSGAPLLVVQEGNLGTALPYFMWIGAESLPSWVGETERNDASKDNKPLSLYSSGNDDVFVVPHPSEAKLILGVAQDQAPVLAKFPSNHLHLRRVVVAEFVGPLSFNSVALNRKLVERWLLRASAMVPITTEQISALVAESVAQTASIANTEKISSKQSSMIRKAGGDTLFGVAPRRKKESRLRMGDKQARNAANDLTEFSQSTAEASIEIYLRLAAPRDLKQSNRTATAGSLRGRSILQNVYCSPPNLRLDADNWTSQDLSAMQHAVGWFAARRNGTIAALSRVIANELYARALPDVGGRDRDRAFEWLSVARSLFDKRSLFDSSGASQTEVQLIPNANLWKLAALRAAALSPQPTAPSSGTPSVSVKSPLIRTESTLIRLEETLFDEMVDVCRQLLVSMKKLKTHLLDSEAPAIDITETIQAVTRSASNVVSIASKSEHGLLIDRARAVRNRSVDMIRAAQTSIANATGDVQLLERVDGCSTLLARSIRDLMHVAETVLTTAAGKSNTPDQASSLTSKVKVTITQWGKANADVCIAMSRQALLDDPLRNPAPVATTLPNARIDELGAAHECFLLGDYARAESLYRKTFDETSMHSDALVRFLLSRFRFSDALRVCHGLVKPITLRTVPSISARLSGVNEFVDKLWCTYTGQPVGKGAFGEYLQVPTDKGQRTQQSTTPRMFFLRSWLSGDRGHNDERRIADVRALAAMGHFSHAVQRALYSESNPEEDITIPLPDPVTEIFPAHCHARTSFTKHF